MLSQARVAVGGESTQPSDPDQLFRIGCLRARSRGNDDLNQPSQSPVARPSRQRALLVPDSASASDRLAAGSIRVGNPPRQVVSVRRVSLPSRPTLGTLTARDRGLVEMTATSPSSTPSESAALIGDTWKSRRYGGWRQQALPSPPRSLVAHLPCSRPRRR
jgi:hypothetical protein